MNYTARLKRLRELLSVTACDALLIENPIDLLYLTGLHLSAGHLVVGLQDSCLIVDGRYYEKSCQQSLYPVELLEKSKLKDWLQHTHLTCLGFDQEKTSYQRYVTLNTFIHEKKIKEVIPLTPLVQQLRLIKDQQEIDLLRKAAKLGYAGYEYIASLLEEGITESELALKLEFFWKTHGAQRLAFESIIAFGVNSSMPHYRAGTYALKLDQIVLMDIGLVLNDYHSDMTRVVYFGQPSKKLEEIQQVVQDAKDLALSHCRPGVLIGHLDQIARDHIQSKGYGDYFTHSLGHGIGLEVHEIPTIRQTGASSTLLLQPGMVITIEPGIYLPGIGGIRLEDTIVITETSYENLTQS